MKDMVKSEDIKAVVTEAVEQATKKLGDRQDQIEKQFIDLKTEFGKLMEEIRSAPTASHEGPRAKRRATSADPSNSAEGRSPTVVIKQFPHPMWRKRIIEVGEALIKPRLPSATKFKSSAFDNTKFLKVTFDNMKDAETLIDSCRNNELIFKVGQTEHRLRVQWDKSPDDRAKGWVISQLWTALETMSADQQKPLTVGCRSRSGQVLASTPTDDSPKVVFTVSEDGSSVEPDANLWTVFGISESDVNEIIASVFAKKRS